MEIRVIVSDPLAASDLTWSLNAAARVTQTDDGAGVVHVQADKNVRHILSEIRDWVTLRRIASVVVHVGDEAHTLVPDHGAA